MFDEYIDFMLKKINLDTIEISDGSIDLNTKKNVIIFQNYQKNSPQPEVGYKKLIVY